MNPFELLGRYFWVLALGTCVHRYVRSADHPSLETLEPDARRRVAFYRNVACAVEALPWVVMGAGILTGSVRDLWGFFRLKDGNPFVTAFAAVAVLASLSFAAWVFSGGAKTVVELDLEAILFSKRGRATERRVKATSALGVAGVAAWLGMALSIEVPVEPGSAIPTEVRGAALSEQGAANGFRLVFDVAHQGLDPWMPCFTGLAFVAIGFVLVRFREELVIGGPAFARKWLPILWLGSALLGTLFLSAATYVALAGLEAAVEAGRAEVVEGTVAEFVPAPRRGRSVERFCVEERCFLRSAQQLTGGFDGTVSPWGPIRPGRHVRVTYVGDSIVRLEVAASGSEN